MRTLVGHAKGHTADRSGVRLPDGPAPIRFHHGHRERYRGSPTGTRGADLAAGAGEVKIHGAYVPVRAEVVQLDGFSSHADYAEILGWLAGLPVPPHQVFVTHGEPAAADALRRRIEERFGWACRVPAYGERARLAAPGGPSSSTESAPAAALASV